MPNHTFARATACEKKKAASAMQGTTNVAMRGSTGTRKRDDPPDQSESQFLKEPQMGRRQKWNLPIKRATKGKKINVARRSGGDKIDPPDQNEERLERTAVSSRAKLLRNLRRRAARTKQALEVFVQSMIKIPRDANGRVATTLYKLERSLLCA